MGHTAMRKLVFIVGGGLLAANFFFNPWVLEKRIDVACWWPSLYCSQRMVAMGHLWSDRFSDRERARRWYRQAAEAGYAPGMFHLGWLYVQDAQDALFNIQTTLMARRRAGETVDFQNVMDVARAPYKEAVDWFRRAADESFSPAMVMLGEYYRNGKLAAAEPEQAFQWYLTAARAGNPVAVLHVHSAYRRGDGVPRNPEEANSWSEWTPRDDGPDVELIALKRTLFQGSRVSDLGLREIRKGVETGEPVNVVRILFGAPSKDTLFRHAPVNTSLHPSEKK
jgi:hypothetical protein